MAPVLALFLHEESIEDGTEVFGVKKVLCLLDEVCALKKKKKNSFNTYLG